MKLALPFISGLLLSGCALAKVELPDEPLEASQVYAGYPCQDRCERFKAGYEAAKTENLNETAQCADSNDAEEIGCKAYVNDYKYATSEDKELMAEIEERLRERSKAE